MKVYYTLYEKYLKFKKPPFFKDNVKILFSSSYEKTAKEIAQWFKERGANVEIAPYLGCQAREADILVADGTFHLDSSLILNKAIWFFDGSWKKIAIKHKKKEKGFLIEYYDKIGIMVSLKPGQNNFALAKKLKKMLEKEGKKVYTVFFDEIDGLEDFNFIKLWINTACPRIEGKGIVQAYEVINYLKNKNNN